MRLKGKDGISRALYVTAFLGCLEVGTGELAYSNAGHNIPYLIDGNGVVRRLAGAHRLPLGILGAHPYDTATVRLERGDRIFLYTDGVTEALDGKGDEFSVERLEELLAREAGGSAGDLVQRCFEAVRGFAGEAAQSDDITVMALRYLSP